MTAAESYAACANQNRIAMAVRRAAIREALMLGLTDTPATRKLVLEAVRNAMQHFQTAYDCDVELGLGDRTQMPPQLAEAVFGLLGGKGAEQR